MVRFFQFLIILVLLNLAVNAQEELTDTTVALLFIQKADRCIDELFIDSALVYYQNAQNIYKNTNHVSGYAIASNGIGESLVRNNKLVKGLILLQNTQKYILDNIGDSSIILADNYNKLAIAYYFASDFENAILHLKKSLQIKKEVLPENHSSIADTYNNLGVIYDMLGKKEDALKAYLKSVDILKTSINTSQVDLANTLENIAIVYDQLSDYELALKYEKQAKQIFLDEFGKDHLKYLNSKELIGVLYYHMEYYKQAEVILKEIFDKKKKTLDNSNIYMINSYINLGNLYFDVGDINKALNFHLTALEHYNNYITNEENYTSTDLYNNIGNCYDELGQHELAKSYYLKSINIAKKLFGKKHIVLATYYNNLGSTYNNIGDYKTALDYLLKAEEILLNNYDSSKTLVNVYSNLYYCYYYLGSASETMKYFHKAIDLSKKIFMEPGASVSTIYSNRGVLSVDNNDFQSAKKYFQKALEIREKTFGNKNPNVASSLNSIGVVYYRTEKYDSALINFQNALYANVPGYKIETGHLNDNEYLFYCPKYEIPFSYFELIRSVIQKILIFETLFHETEKTDYLLFARDHYFYSDTVFTEFRKGLTNKEDKLVYTELIGDLFPNAVKTCYKLFNITGDRTYLENAFYFLQKSKSLLLLETINSINAREIAGVPKEILDKERNIIDEINLYQRKILSSETQDVAESYNKVCELNHDYIDLIKLIKDNYPNYYHLKYDLKLNTIREIQGRLNPEDCIISYIDAEEYYLVCYLSHNDCKFKYIDLPDGFNEKIDYMRRSMMYPDSERLQDIYRRNAYSIYQVIFPEEIPDIVENLIIIPDSKLSMIPFEALLTEEVGSNESFVTYPFLVKKYNISYQYSEKILYDNLTNDEEKDRVQNFIAFAPIFKDEITGTANRQISNVIQNSISAEETEYRTRMVDRNMISSLPGTEDEVKSIYELFDSNKKLAKVYLNQAADEATLKKLDLMSYAFIHFATHGFTNTSNPELSGLILAQNTATDEDNILFVDEILSLKMNPTLVILSACETGLGKLYKSEGLVGLSRALMYSGAKNISVSLWQVSDESTRDLMIEFYKNYFDNDIKESNFASSFRLAKLELIKQEKYAHPFYWSPFILIGK